MKTSIVIPVYNEAAHLGACLEAISRQTIQPLEVIVVDNNSSDTTAQVAASYPFVTLLHEARQGVVHARSTGFNHACGDIIGRLDADSIISPDWVATAELIFAEDTELAAVSGQVTYYGLAYSRLLSRVDLHVRRRLARLLGRDVALQGANLAVRRHAWRAVRHQTCRRGAMHEDFDLGIHLNRAGYTNRFDERLQVGLDCRRLQSTWRDFRRYAFLSPQTYKQHGLRSRRHMYPVVLAVIILYFPLRLLHLGYDADSRRFSWRHLLLTTAAPRVNPATFVD